MIFTEIAFKDELNGNPDVTVSVWQWQMHNCNSTFWVIKNLQFYEHIIIIL